MYQQAKKIPRAAAGGEEIGPLRGPTDGTKLLNQGHLTSEKK
jgi:hypothetical protein